MTAGQVCIFGEVLFDQFPDGQQVLGGAPFNVAWHLQAFDQNPCFVSRVGADPMGEAIRRAMLDWGMNVDNVQTDPDYPTGAVKVNIHNGEPDYEILADQAYDFIAADQLRLANEVSVIYHGTLALRHHVSRKALDELKARHSGKVFVDVNLREPWWQAEAVSRYVSGADWVKLNHHELMHLAPQQGAIEETMRLFLARHKLEVLVVTCGSQGAMAVNNAGQFAEVSPAGNLSVVDTVGAGDGFSAVLLLGLQYGWPLQLIMDRAQSFASALVTRQGGTVQDLGFYQAFRDAWGLDLA
ncbi:MAG: carbohydrate kinase [Methylobacter sp.]|jgi:fructokinase